MKPKIVFIINCISQGRCLKRVQEFIDNGYEVVVYGFERSRISLYNTQGIDCKVLGCITEEMSFLRRLQYVRMCVREVFCLHGTNDVLYYIFSLDIALSCYQWLKKNKYIYEESDMMHTYVGNKIVRNTLEFLDKLIIRKSLRSVLTSSGFAEYHWGNNIPQNVSIITNRLDKDILKYPIMSSKRVDIEHLRIGFVGMIRSDSVCILAEEFLKRFRNCEVHFYGVIPELFEGFCEPLKVYPNYYFHGKFKNPEDLPKIYSNIDILLSTYNAKSVNVQYAEPNKLYEAMYFQTPIIVSRGTFLERKVKELGIGFSVDVFDSQSVNMLIDQLTQERLTEVTKKISKIDKKDSINVNEQFFTDLEHGIKKSYFTI